MPRFATRLLLVLGVFALVLGAAPQSHAAPTSYHASLSGPNEQPPNASPGIGDAQVDVDPVAHTMRVRVVFSGLLGTVTASHIHGPTAVAFAGTAGVATTTPTFTGFPSGVTFGSYDHTFDMTLTSSYNGSFITANGGTPASAETALFQAMADGKAYLNVHSSSFSGGEIRGFLTPFDPVPAHQPSWGRVKKLYR